MKSSRRASLAVAMMTLAAAGACGSSDGDSADDGVEDLTAIEQMSISFNGSDSEEEIREAMDNALNATNTPITEDNYSRAGSVVVKFRQDYGINEMDILECIPSMVTDPRVPSVTFPNVAAVCNVAFVQGER